MKKKTLLLVVFALTCGLTAHAKDNLPSGKSAKNAVMPAVGSFEMNGYEETKKMLASGGASISAVPQKGDPKTSFSKQENSQHAAQTGSPSPTGGYFSWTSATQYTSGSTISVSYFYDTSKSNTFNKVIVTYDAATLQPLSATGLKVSVLSTVPDLTGMTLVSTAFHSDGTLANQTYQSGPDASGVTTLVSVNYDFGQVSYVAQIVSQPLDVKDPIFTKMYQQAFL